MRRGAQIQGLTQSRGEGKLSWLRALLGEPGEEQGRREEKPQNATVRRGHFQGQLSLTLPQLKGPETSETQQAKPALHGKVGKKTGACALEKGGPIPENLQKATGASLQRNTFTRTSKLHVSFLGVHSLPKNSWLNGFQLPGEG